MKVRSLAMATALSCSLLTSCASIAPKQEAQQVSKPKNIIYMIGDGMGMAHLTAYRHYKNSTASKIGLGDQAVPKTLFDKNFVGVASTLPEDDTLVTDSAAGATALSSGEKTYNGAIALDNDKTATFTLIERAKQLGMLTGTVSTSQITHATPASFWAHNVSRRNEQQIADAAFDDRMDGKFKTDLLLGGGKAFLIREDRDLTKEFQQAGWQYTGELTQLEQLTKLPALGLFADKGLGYAIDNPQLPNRLEVMTEKALQLLNANNPNGFFVMIEGSQIDWCSHANDIACAMEEMKDFEQTLAKVLEFAKKDGNTLVVLTADHSTGGLTVGANKQYKWLPNVVHQVGISAQVLTQKLLAGADVVSTWQQFIQFPLTKAQAAELTALQTKKDGRGLNTAIVKITSDASFTGWTTTGHTGEDVGVIAFGPNAEQFRGAQDNTDLAKKLFNLLD